MCDLDDNEALPTLIGLCGRSGSGKGMTAGFFRDCGIPSVDTDAVYRELTGPSAERADCMAALAEAFGENVVAEDNSLDRQAMRDLVFGEENRENLEKLDKITHRFILEKTLEICRKLASKGYRAVIIDAPLLFESGFDRLCAKNICVTADEDVIMKRIIQRDGITPDKAKERLAAQKSAAEIAARSDYVIDNSGTPDELREKVEILAKELKTIEVKI